MNVLYVYAHPSSLSFNQSLKEVGLKKLRTMGHNVRISDLYSQCFQGTASIADFDKNNISLAAQKEMEKIVWADHLILQFPLWWFSVPAILKGWFDRVFIKGFAYDTGHVFSLGLLHGKTASLIVTTQSPEAAYQKQGIHGKQIEAFLLSTHHTLNFAGVNTEKPFISYGVFNLKKKAALDIFKNYLSYLESRQRYGSKKQ